MNGTVPTAFSGATSGVAFSCVAGSCVPYYVNPAVEQLTGYGKEGFSACPHLWLKLIVTEDRQRVIEGLAELMAEGTLEIEYRIVNAAGGLRHVRSMAKVVRGTRRRPARIDGVVVEVPALATDSVALGTHVDSPHAAPTLPRRRAEDIASYHEPAAFRHAARPNYQTVPTDVAPGRRLECAYGTS
jgi:hypothetical protein